MDTAMIKITKTVLSHSLLHLSEPVFFLVSSIGILPVCIPCIDPVLFFFSSGFLARQPSFLLPLRHLYPSLTIMTSQPLVAPSPMTQLLEQLALDDLQSSALSKHSPDSSVKTLTEEPQSLFSSPTTIESPSFFTNSRDSSLTVESAASPPGPSREGSCIIPAGPSQNSSTTSFQKSSETPPLVPQYDPINAHPPSLHLSASSPALRRGTSILRTPSITDQSASVSSNPPSPPSPMSPITPSVRFAPLPEVERRKRKHSQRLGVAARSQLLARRRQMMRETDDPDRPPQNLWRSDEEEEDPLVALGHMVKLASIGIWRKVSWKDRKARPELPKRSNSDSVLEITRPVTYTEAGDEVLIELVEDSSDDKTPLPQAETTETKTTDDEVVVVETEATPTVLIPTAES